MAAKRPPPAWAWACASKASTARPLVGRGAAFGRPGSPTCASRRLGWGRLRPSSRSSLRLDTDCAPQRAGRARRSRTPDKRLRDRRTSRARSVFLQGFWNSTHELLLGADAPYVSRRSPACFQEEEEETSRGKDFRHYSARRPADCIRRQSRPGAGSFQIQPRHPANLSADGRIGLSWHTARDYARSLGGYLVAVNSTDEEVFLTSAFENVALIAWIGLSDEAIEGVYVWESGEPLGYTDWCAGDPNNSLGVEDWARVYFPGFGNHCWSDVPSFGDPTWIPNHGIVELPYGDRVNFDGLASSCNNQIPTPLNAPGNAEGVSWNGASVSCPPLIASTPRRRHAGQRNALPAPSVSRHGEPASRRAAHPSGSRGRERGEDRDSGGSKGHVVRLGVPEQRERPALQRRGFDRDRGRVRQPHLGRGWIGCGHQSSLLLLRVLLQCLRRQRPVARGPEDQQLRCRPSVSGLPELAGWNGPTTYSRAA